MDLPVDVDGGQYPKVFPRIWCFFMDDWGILTNKEGYFWDMHVWVGSHPHQTKDERKMGLNRERAHM